MISAAALESARADKTVEGVMTLASTVLNRADVMDGVVEMIPRVQLEAVFDDGSGSSPSTRPFSERVPRNTR